MTLWHEPYQVCFVSKFEPCGKAVDVQRRVHDWQSKVEQPAKLHERVAEHEDVRLQDVRKVNQHVCAPRGLKHDIAHAAVSAIMRA